ncbi:MAG: MmcQ/YjbR family DNA-binding protein [Gammaproteobacteria bacterium]
MTVDELKQFCRAFAGATETVHGAPSNVLVYSVGDKHFAYFKLSEPEKWRFSLRVTPDRFVELTGIDGVKPARYMGRFHWVTIVQVSHFPQDYLEELVSWSYHKALGSLTKARQRAVTGGQDRTSPHIATDPSS